jgi:GAF domain-containing protein
MQSPERDHGFARQASRRALDLLEAGAPAREVLTLLAAAGEQVAGPGSVVSILVLDKDGLLRNGASPNLPADYLDAIDRLKPQRDLGTCAAAAARGEAVITPDFCADQKWAELRHLPLALGFVGAWSQPIKDAAGHVLGTFGTYYRARREPSDAERDAVLTLASAAATTLTQPGLATGLAIDLA